MQATYWRRPSSSIGGGVMRIIPVLDHLSCFKNEPNNIRRFSMDEHCQCSFKCSRVTRKDCKFSNLHKTQAFWILYNAANKSGTKDIYSDLIPCILHFTDSVIVNVPLSVLDMPWSISSFSQMLKETWILNQTDILSRKQDE